MASPEIQARVDFTRMRFNEPVHEKMDITNSNIQKKFPCPLAKPCYNFSSRREGSMIIKKQV
jgi:hypothetical protein